MRCPIETQENAELLLAYCARTLDSESMAVLERHILTCPACRSFQEAQESVWKALDEWEAMPVSTDFDRRLYRRIDQEQQSSWWDRVTRPLRPVLVKQGIPLAAAACLLVMAGAILERPDKVAVPVRPAQVEAVQADQVERTLDDLEMLHEFNLAVRADLKQSNSM